MPSSPVTSGRLADWIVSQKETFLADLAAGRGKGWTVAVGNEAGDLDTIASSIAYAFLASTLRAQRVVPVILTPKKYMRLRPENLMALERSSIPADNLLHIEDLSVKAGDLIGAGVEFALVDHNRLLKQFGTDDAAYNQVNAILDHHEDEGVSLNASPRTVVVPCGSCTTLVALNFKDEWTASLSGPAKGAGSPVPPEVGTLLVSGIMIDTKGLKKGRKTTDRDIDAAQFLYSVSSLQTAGTTAAVAITSDTDTDKLPDTLQVLSQDLVLSKYDVTDMSGHDLLVRDYKEYLWETSSKVFPKVVVGLCTVPVKLERTVTLEGGWGKSLPILDDYMEELKLDLLGIATTWRNKRGKHRRELLLSVRSGGALADIDAAKRILDALAKGLEADSETFDLKPWKHHDESLAPADNPMNTSTRVAHVWRQGNARSTRKQIAPAMHRIVSSLT
ncbi:hypothetical protein CspeluHIS016_0201410 [Cutaneotrichosporon spelunceum]|uniref:DHHA2 domain-containing protein n=1 Tax=Cutaneotrichosporon spelunceum TaxID=1672016 RepID=A0AAD3Y9K7_9TREE|nr:hypothetical protein CspeluHIS016_0201410 [Cutaneotrichosporon spelunceum]